MLATRCYDVSGISSCQKLRREHALILLPSHEINHLPQNSSKPLCDAKTHCFLNDTPHQSIEG
jgi:hypothetical protein